MIYLIPIILIISQVLDTYTTYRVLNRGGIELNSLVNWVMKKLGVLRGLIVLKIVVTTALLLIFYTFEYSIIGYVLGGISGATLNAAYRNHKQT